MHEHIDPKSHGQVNEDKAGKNGQAVIAGGTGQKQAAGQANGKRSQDLNDGTGGGVSGTGGVGGSGGSVL